MSDESLELGKKWLKLMQAAVGARQAADDMRVALDRMETDQSDAAWNIAQAKKGILLSMVSNLGDLACSGLAANQICKLGKDIAKTLNGAWQCGEGNDKGCAGATLSYSKAVARVWTDGGHRVVDGYKALDGVRRGEFGLDEVVAACNAVALSDCPVVALVKNSKEAMEVRALQGQLDTIFNNNLSIGKAGLQRVEQQAQELERHADEARTVYQAQREKDETIKAEQLKKEQEEMAQAKKVQEEREQAQQSVSASPTTASPQTSAEPTRKEQDEWEEGSGSSGSTHAGTDSAPSEEKNQSQGGGNSFDVTAWNYGDPVPGVERLPEFDKPRRKIPCHFRDTSCLDPFPENSPSPSEEKTSAPPNPWSQEIEQKIKEGLLSSEQIRQEIEQKVKGGLSNKNQQGPCDENLGCPDDEPANGLGKDLLAKLDANLEGIQNSQPGTAGGVLPGEAFDAGESSSPFDKMAMLKSLRSGLGAYRQGRESFSSSGSSSGGGSGSFAGNCPNMVPYPPELVPIAQRRGTPLPPMPTVDEMISQAGGSDAAASGLRQQIQAQQQALAQWPSGREEGIRRMTELTVRHNQQILQAMECRSGTRLHPSTQSGSLNRPAQEALRQQEPPRFLSCVTPSGRRGQRVYNARTKSYGNCGDCGGGADAC